MYMYTTYIHTMQTKRPTRSLTPCTLHLIVIEAAFLHPSFVRNDLDATAQGADMAAWQHIGWSGSIHMYKPAGSGSLVQSTNTLALQGPRAGDFRARTTEPKSHSIDLGNRVY